MITLTEKAADQVKSVVESHSLPEKTLLRVELLPENSQGMPKLSLELDTNEPGPEDVVVATGGLRLALSRALADVLGDGRLDYQEDAGGFVLDRGGNSQ